MTAARYHRQRICDCADCGRRRPNKGRNLCDTCWQRNWKNGTLDAFPRATRPRADVLEDWAFLASQGYTRRTAADRMGISKDCLDKAIERDRRRNDTTTEVAA